MIGIVFAFGLSFLGVWEIPIPGFVGSSTVQGAAEREGAIGAFSKGVLSTVLATPCAGPLLVPAVSWAIAQPAWLTFLAFTCIGLGMATPYLLIGAFPQLISFLPKPGQWMDTFKQLMGFLLLGTVVFLFCLVGTEVGDPDADAAAGNWHRLLVVGQNAVDRRILHADDRLGQQPGRDRRWQPSSASSCSYRDINWIGFPSVGPCWSNIGRRVGRSSWTSRHIGERPARPTRRSP